MPRDVLLRQLDADLLRVGNLGDPAVARDATFTDNVSSPSAVGAATSSPGKSLLAAPADHQHPSLAPMRIAASGTTVIGPGARITLATFKRGKGELFPPGGFAYVREDKDGLTWENEVGGADDIALYHERAGTADELRFRAYNASDRPRTLEWATVALTPPAAA